jgi:thrombospondin type 3 repeat protein
MVRAARTVVVLATIAVSVSCQTVEDPLPPQASLNFDITDSAIGSQRLPLPSPQVVSWRVEELSASNITGFDGTYSFLFSGPCTYQLNVLAPLSFQAVCRTSGLTLAPGGNPRNAALRITLSRLEVRAAARPDLSNTADPDGDGIPNATDNCPIVANPSQDNVNPSQEILKVGDACSDFDKTGKRTIPDQDLDGVPDASDNCLWYPNPLVPGEITPTDADRDGIGDACERIAPVVLPNGRLTIECDNVTFNALPSKIAFFRIDFGRPGVLTCDPGFTGCTIDPSAVRVSLSGSTTTFPCH